MWQKILWWYSTFWWLWDDITSQAVMLFWFLICDDIPSYVKFCDDNLCDDIVITLWWYCGDVVIQPHNAYVQCWWNWHLSFTHKFYPIILNTYFFHPILSLNVWCLTYTTVSEEDGKYCSIKNQECKHRFWICNLVFSNF